MAGHYRAEGRVAHRTPSGSAIKASLNGAQISDPIMIYYYYREGGIIGIQSPDNNGSDQIRLDHDIMEMIMSKQTVLDLERNVDELEDDRDRVIGALGSVDYMLGIASEWSEFIFEEEGANYDWLCRMIGAVKVPRKIKVGSLEDMKSYLLNQHRNLSEQIDMEKDKLLRLLREQRDQMIQHYRDQYEDAHNRLKKADHQSFAWHRLQANMETYKHLLFVANRDPADQ